MVNNHGDRFRALRIGLWVVPSIHGRFMAYKWGVILSNITKWDDPPGIAQSNF